LIPEPAKHGWPTPDATVRHPEVKNPVGSQLYLGYGPLKFANSTALKANAAIQADESATLSLAVPNNHAAHIEHALTLMNHYGTLGGRSRNGWGSFSLTPIKDTSALNIGRAVPDAAATGRPMRDWKLALGLDWPHAIGQNDTGALIWQTAPHDDWKALMKTLASIKIGLRTQFKFPHERPDGEIHDRHWLSYPVTKHSVKSWGNNARLPNSLRFKVRTAPDDPKQVVGVIFHVPCKPPLAFSPNAATLETVWQGVHAFLDAPAQSLIRIPE